MAFSTPLICCSNGVITDSAIVLGEAPGYWPLTTTVGGTISGYSLIGSAGIASRPATVKRMAITVAKIGRSIKKDEMFMAPVSILHGRWAGARLIGGHRHSLWRDGDFPVHALSAVHDHDVAPL